MSTAVSQQIGPEVKAGRKEWIGLAVLALPALLVSMDMTVMYLAVPAVSAALRPNSVELLWISDAFGFLEAGFLITMGTLGDRLGRRRLLLTGGVVFSLASVLAAFSPSAVLLILARGLLGIAGATLLPSTLSIIRNMFHDERQRTIAIGTWTTCFSAGTMLGPVIGGFLLHQFWWGAVFLMPVPVMILLLFVGPRLLPEFRAEKPAPMDLVSTALLIVAILAMIYGVKQLAEVGVSKRSQGAWGMLPVAFIVIGVAVGIVFLRRQRRVRHPLINTGLFHNSHFNTALTALLFALFSWSGMFLFVSQYLQLVLGFDPVKSGLLTMPGAAASIVGCMLTPVMVRYIPRGYLMTIGLVVLAAGIGMFAFIGMLGLAILVIAAVLMGVGCSITVTLGIDRVVAAAPPESAGEAAGISETSTTLGSALGIALLGSIWTAGYHSRIETRMPSDVPIALKEMARNTLAGAVSASERLHGGTGIDLINNARLAFVQSLNVTAMVCAVAVLVVAIFVCVRLRKVR